MKVSKLMIAKCMTIAIAGGFVFPTLACPETDQAECEEGQLRSSDSNLIIRADAEDEQSISIMQRITDDGETIELFINGEHYVVDSMEEIEEILVDLGLKSGLQFDFEFDGDHFENHDVIGGRGHKQHRDIDDDFGHQEFRWESDKDDFEFEEPRAMLGVHMDEVPDAVREYMQLDDDEGVMVSKVIDGTAADKAGLEPQDIIIGVIFDDEYEDVNSETLGMFIAEMEPGEILEIQVLRAGRPIEIRAKLTPWDGKMLGMPMMELRIDDEEFMFDEKHQFMELDDLRIPHIERFMIKPGEEGLIELGEEGFIELRELMERVQPQRLERFHGQRDDMRRMPDRKIELHEMMMDLHMQMMEMQEQLHHMMRQQEELQERFESEDVNFDA